MRILLLEDERNIARPLIQAFKAEGHSVTWAQSMAGAHEAFLAGEPDLLILDVRLPGDPDGGFHFAEEVRHLGCKAPILFLTARDTLADRIKGLDLGGDDYLTKPFALEELLARVRALLRRSAEVKQSRFCHGALEIDLAARTLRHRGRTINLSPKEFALLETLALNPQRVYAAEELAERIFGNPERTGAVKVYVHYLRQKVAPSVIRTVPGGYRMGEG